MNYSLVIPVYKNEDSIELLISTLSQLSKDLGGELEVVFVIDGSPDRSQELLEKLLPSSHIQAQVLASSRNFGAFSAIRMGLEAAQGTSIAVMSADMQEPPELVKEFFQALDSEEFDIVFGVRSSRDDPWSSTVASQTFWWFYQRFVEPACPVGGVDMFAMTDSFRDHIVEMREANSSLLGLLFWLGGRRKFVPYHRKAREHGKSAWTLQKKITYLLDSVFAFTDLPVRLMMLMGALGIVLALLLALVIFTWRLSGIGVVPGYAGTMLTIIFFGALNLFGLGVVGNYSWRSYENTKRRPLNILANRKSFNVVTERDEAIK
ncbi:MAG: glycosyltransferase family 2 protein [Candidatus Melainabacteria bacterium]|nr:glycosyltransferase family 2 protein [Candidatus Melainabacteria bacterium]